MKILVKNYGIYLDLTKYDLLSTMKSLLCKLKDRVATEDKNNIVHEIDCNNCKAAYLGESKQSLKLHSDEYKWSVKNWDCEQNETAKYCWEADHIFSSDHSLGPLIWDHFYYHLTGVTCLLTPSLQQLIHSSNLIFIRSGYGYQYFNTTTSKNKY